MTIALEHPAAATAGLSVSTTTGLLGMAGVASLGAGAVHAAAIGVHSEHRAAVLAFTAIAALQLAWGVLALVRDAKWVSLLGVVVSVGAIGGWFLAKTVGISFVAGLDEAEAIQTADAIAAGLAAASLVTLAIGALRARSAQSGLHAPIVLAAVAIGAVAIAGMVSAGSHAHASAGHSGDAAAAGGGDHGAGAVAAPDDHHTEDDAHAEEAAGADDGAHGNDADHGTAPAVATVPYDPTKPIDLSGVEGVTLEQQAMAENIVAVTVMRLGQWADPAVAEAAGFRSIGDGGTGHEHFINQEFREDGIYLDPDRPESLVYDTSSGERRLVAAMYMLDTGLPLEDVPDYGGDLMQWHIHDNLCYSPEGKVRGLTDAEGNCAAGLVKPVPAPMIHVWVEPHPCGPFAALEGIAGGSVPEGEEILCDHAHGA